MSVRKTDHKTKPWLSEIYPDGREGPRKRKRFATKGEALAWESHMLTAKPWQVKEEDAGDQRRLSDLVSAWFGRHGQTLTDGERRRDKLVWLCEALDNPLASEFTSEMFSAYRERRLAGELYVPGQRKHVTPTTINREQLYLQAVFNELARLGVWHGGNPLSDLRQYKVQESELAYLSQDE
ncbi:phage integrase, partial [Aeromonas hydrophila]